ncbi:MAG: UMP kinase [Kiritimatiellae bacterium]|nr:UMP kinase [Kiritimatiellia bacterium]MBR1836874.1 UMP kinase [Kiritimatiellia bacterium]
MAPKYKRILLKLSGEVLLDRDSGQCIAPAVLARMAAGVKAVRDMGVDVAIVLGGGNIFRGATGEALGIDRCAGDYMGMLATVINALALQNAIEKTGVPARVMTAFPCQGVAEPFIHRRALRHLEKGRVVLFAAGTGNPLFSTDTCAALRAREIGADVLVKATKVDGVYTADPKKDPSARKLDHLTYAEAISRGLKVMDTAAFALCQEHQIPILVLDFFADGALEAAVAGSAVGTVVDGREPPPVFG